jgi:GNAT superfamily N-acetyltransferase
MVIHLSKVLVGFPCVVEVRGVNIRQMAVPDDVPHWLALREQAVADLMPAPRPWLHADYAAEIFDKPWWHAKWNWVATNDAGEVVGAVTLAIREGEAGRAAVVHWLLVDPAWRRRGIGRVLMSHLEQAAWEAGYREVQLETHADWASAVAFYQSMGYAPVRAASPR